MKTVLFVPGYPEDINSRDYASVMKAIEKQGYKVKFVPIKWKRTTIHDWIQELEKVYSKYDPSETILAGFSYGAMTTFMVATKKNPSQLWLFSLSPYFAEDLKSKNMKPTWLKQIGHRRVTAFNELNFKKLALLIQCKTLLFVGELEVKKWPVIGERVVAAHRLLGNNEFITVKNVGHDVSDKVYIDKITGSLL
jgi:pimeloyl-ACP methyl ester carboxylesterase